MKWTPFFLWTDMWTSGMELATAGLKYGEMMDASAAVIRSRCGSLADAVQNPLEGDYAELGRMVPEKVDAFSRAGRAAFSDLCAIQSDVLANWMLLGAIASARRLPTSAETDRIARRSSRASARASAAAGKMLAPVHRRATGNAKRLKRRKRV